MDAEKDKESPQPKMLSCRREEELQRRIASCLKIVIANVDVDCSHSSTRTKVLRYGWNHFLHLLQPSFIPSLGSDRKRLQFKNI